MRPANPRIRPFYSCEIESCSRCFERKEDLFAHFEKTHRIKQIRRVEAIVRDVGILAIKRKMENDFCRRCQYQKKTGHFHVLHGVSSIFHHLKKFELKWNISWEFKHCFDFLVLRCPLLLALLVDSTRRHFLRLSAQKKFFWRDTINFKELFTKSFGRRWKENLKLPFWRKVLGKWNRSRSLDISEEFVEVNRQVLRNETLLKKFWVSKLENRIVYQWKGDDKLVGMALELAIQVLKLVQSQVVRLVYPLIQRESTRRFHLAANNTSTISSVAKLEYKLAREFYQSKANRRQFHRKRRLFDKMEPKDDMEVVYTGRGQHYDDLMHLGCSLRNLFSEDFQAKLSNEWQTYCDNVELKLESKVEDEAEDSELSMIRNYFSETLQGLSKAAEMSESERMSKSSAGSSQSRKLPVEGNTDFLKSFMPSNQKEKTKPVKENVNDENLRLQTRNEVESELKEVVLEKRADKQLERESGNVADFLKENYEGNYSDDEGSRSHSREDYRPNLVHNTKFLSNLFGPRPVD